MASLTVRQLDDKLKRLLRLRAARHGRSMEDEVRVILRQAAMETAREALNLLNPPNPPEEPAQEEPAARAARRTASANGRRTDAAAASHPRRRTARAFFSSSAAALRPTNRSISFAACTSTASTCAAFSPRPRSISLRRSPPVRLPASMFTPICSIRGANSTSAIFVSPAIPTSSSSRRRPPI